MANINGGRLVARVLKQEGVERIFALCGGHIDPIFQGCLDEGIEVIDHRHEQAAAFAAEGWAWMTGKPGVAVVTAGPGVTNATTGVYNAYYRGAPMILLGGHAGPHNADRGDLQYVDSLPMMTPISKWARACHSIDRLADYVSMAFRQALSGRPGPAYLELGGGALHGQVDDSKLVMPRGYRTEARPQGDPALVEKAVDMLLAAEKPIIFAGGGVWWSQAAAELREFAEMAGIPVTEGLCTKYGSLPADHPLALGFPSPTADVILLLAHRLDFISGYGQPPQFGADSRWIQVDIEPEAIGHNRPIDVGIVGDARAVLQQMLDVARDKCKGRAELPWATECRTTMEGQREALNAQAATDEVPIHPLRICKEIDDFLDRDATVIIDGGDVMQWANRTLRAYEPGHWLSSLHTGTLGGGASCAIAAQLARPGKQVLLLSGDGTFGLNGMEFDTMVRHKLPVVCVVGNNEGWDEITVYQEQQGPDRVIGTKLGFVRYDKMVEALGGYGEVVEKPEELRPALERAFASGLPACINVWTASANPFA